MTTSVRAELALPGSGFSDVSEILWVGALLELSVTDGDAKRSFTARLPASIFLLLNFSVVRVDFRLIICSKVSIYWAFVKSNTLYLVVFLDTKPV